MTHQSHFPYHPAG